MEKDKITNINENSAILRDKVRAIVCEALALRKGAEMEPNTIYDDFVEECNEFHDYVSERTVQRIIEEFELLVKLKDRSIMYFEEERIANKLTYENFKDRCLYTWADLGLSNIDILRIMGLV